MNSLPLGLIVSSSFLDLSKPAFDMNLLTIFAWVYPWVFNAEMSGSWCTLYHSLPCLPSSFVELLSRCVLGVDWYVTVWQAPSALFRTSWLIWCCNGTKTAHLAVACSAHGVLCRALGSTTLMVTVSSSATSSCLDKARAIFWLTRAPSRGRRVLLPFSMLQDTDALIGFAGGPGSRPSFPLFRPPPLYTVLVPAQCYHDRSCGHHFYP
jgi:hypothetical protein